MFEHVIDALVHGSGYERIATTRCSDRTIRRRVKDWAAAGIGQRVHALALAAYDQMIGLSLQDLSVDGAITKAPRRGERAGRSPVDRGKGGLKRSTEVEGDGIPLALVSAPANRHDSPLLRPTCEAATTQVGPMPDDPTMHLDRAYDNTPTRDLLDELGLHGEIAAPIQVDKRWVVKRTNSWMNGYGKTGRVHGQRGPLSSAV